MPLLFAVIFRSLRWGAPQRCLLLDCFFSLDIFILKNAFTQFIIQNQVFWGHACQHLEINQPLILKEIWWAFRGVPVFFIISGFLIWNSLEKNYSFMQYLSKRVIRLYPELWGGVFVNAVIMIIIYHKEIKIVPFILFQITQSTVLQFWTPESLRNYGNGTPNGSLWTICVMVQCYIVLYFLHKFLHKKRFIVIPFSAGMFINIFTPFLSGIVLEIIYKLFRQTFVPYIWLFIFGAIMCEYFDKIINFLTKYWWLFIIMLLVVNFLKIERNVGIYEPINSILLGLTVIGFGYSVKIKVKYDFSYGFYIYHMIIINVLVEFGLIGNILYLLIAFVISGVMAVISFFSLGYISRKLKNIDLLNVDRKNI